MIEFSLGLLPEGNLIVGPGPLICHLYGLIIGWEEQGRWGNGSGCYVSRCLWPANITVQHIAIKLCFGESISTFFIEILIEFSSGLLPEGNLIVGPNPLICHFYSLIIRWEEQRSWGNGSGCYVSRCQ